MRRFVIFSLFVLSFSAVCFAQSGRKIAPKPTPDQTIAQQNKNENEGFSESKPMPKRSVSPFPGLKNIPKTDSKTQPQTQTKDAEILSDSEDDVVRVETNLVTIPVSVFDRNGLYIPDLYKDNFKIFEDGKEQPIEFFATTENPFTVVILIDVSPSTAFKIEEIQDAAMAFVNQLKPQDSVMVIEFDQSVKVLTEATTDRQKIYKALRKSRFGNGTSLYEAVENTIRKRLNKISGRKAIVLFTDGVDTTSYKSSYDRSLREAEEADATIFPIYYNTFFDNRRPLGGVNFPGTVRNPQGTSSSDYAMGRQYLKDLADSTGGRVFNAENSAGSLTRTFENIAEELRRQYSIGYIPENPGQAGQRKQIKVRVNRPNLIIRARDSYIVGEQNKPATPTPAKSK